MPKKISLVNISIYIAPAQKSVIFDGKIIPCLKLFLKNHKLFREMLRFCLARSEIEKKKFDSWHHAELAIRSDDSIKRILLCTEKKPIS